MRCYDEYAAGQSWEAFYAFNYGEDDEKFWRGTGTEDDDEMEDEE